MKITRRIVHPAHLAKGLEQLAQPAIHQGHRARIGPPQAEQLGLVEHVSHRAGRYVDQHRNVLDVDLLVLERVLDQVSLLAGLEFVGLDRGVLVAIGLGRVPRTVGAEQVEPEQERIGLAAPAIQPVDGRSHGPRHAGVLLVVGAEHRAVPQELLPPRLPEVTGRIVVGREPEAGLVGQVDVPDPGIGRRHERIVALPAHPDDVVEPPSVAQSGLAEKRDVRDEGGPDPLVPEQVGQDRLIGPQRRPPLLRVGEPVSPGPPAPPGWQGGQVLGEMVIEDDPLRRQAVKVRRLDPGVAVGAQEPQVHAVANHDDDVHGRHCNRSTPGLHGRAGAEP